jgi:hypothetical protein
MLTLFRRPTPPAVAPQPVSAQHRQRFTIEVAFFRSPAELADCLAAPVSGRRVVLYGGTGTLPAALAEMADRVVRAAGVDPLKAAVLAHAGLRDGDTLTVLLPADWEGPPAEVLLDHARRWFASPHSQEDELRVG